MTLIKYRDAGMNTYTYFYVNEHKQIASPYFETQPQAETWLSIQWDAWKPCKDV